MNNPKFKQYSTLEKRVESYKHWPHYSIRYTQRLAEAGLIYTGVGDYVRCYYCGGGLRNWEEGDDPVEEHKRWYENCILSATVINQQEVNSQPVVEENSVHVVDENSVSIQACIQMGYDKKDIYRAVKKYVITNKSNTYTGADISRIIEEDDYEIQQLSEKLSVEVSDKLNL